MDETVDGDVQPNPMQERTHKVAKTRHMKVFIVFHCHMIFSCGFDSCVQ